MLRTSGISSLFFAPPKSSRPGGPQRTLAGPLDTRQTSGAGVAGMILLWLVRSCARVVVRRFRWPQATGRRTPLGCAAGQARGGSCFAPLPRPLLLRKAGLKGSRAMPGGQLLRLAARAPVAPQDGA
ncbi:hypothetical protein [Paenibacillus taichungensis]|uniref:hypothetical protein n=1 Tax=Paenibacillus taichungensis TaxID=484184 RepID=UPI003D9A3A99